MVASKDEYPRSAASGERLDQALVTRGLARSRSQAADLVRRGFVTVGGRVAHKPSLVVAPESGVELAADAPKFVGRGAEKLMPALDRFGFECKGRTAIDVGASTGGFTEVLLQRGARRVFAVDVGHGQLSDGLKSDSRIVMLEKTDARTLTAALIPDAADAIVADVSFISLRKALPAALALAVPGAWLVALVKPQFEVGRDGVGKGGVVRDEDLQRRAVDDVALWLEREMGWRIAGSMASPITGSDGNQEFLLGAMK